MTKKLIKELKKANEDGITLIALVITIIILLILAGVTINLTIGENGIFRTAEMAGKNYMDAQDKEITDLANFENTINNIIGGAEANTEIETEETLIDKVESKVGYYADLDADGDPEGIIYADLVVSKSGQWGDSNGIYSYEAINNVKDYYISKKNHQGPFGTKDVLTAKDEIGEDRFYVMALENFNTGTYYYWYYAAHGNMNDYATATSLEFGKGKENTVAMIAKWNASGYGEQNYNETYLDMWGAIKGEVDKGWFVPSKGEWAAFGDNLGIRPNNYTEYSLSSWYWSSSQYNINNAWSVAFVGGNASNANVNDNGHVRLSTTF